MLPPLLFCCRGLLLLLETVDVAVAGRGHGHRRGRGCGHGCGHAVDVAMDVAVDVDAAVDVTMDVAVDVDVAKGRDWPARGRTRALAAVRPRCPPVGGGSTSARRRTIAR